MVAQEPLEAIALVVRIAFEADGAERHRVDDRLEGGGADGDANHARYEHCDWGAGANSVKPGRRVVDAPVYLGEEVEYALQFAGRDAEAIVSDDHLRVDTLTSCGNLDVAAGLGELAGVLSRFTSTWASCVGSATSG